MCLLTVGVLPLQCTLIAVLLELLPSVDRFMSLVSSLLTFVSWQWSWTVALDTCAVIGTCNVCGCVFYNLWFLTTLWFLAAYSSYNPIGNSSGWLKDTLASYPGCYSHACAGSKVICCCCPSVCLSVCLSVSTKKAVLQIQAVILVLITFKVCKTLKNCLVYASFR